MKSFLAMITPVVSGAHPDHELPKPQPPTGTPPHPDHTLSIRSTIRCHRGHRSIQTMVCQIPTPIRACRDHNPTLSTPSFCRQIWATGSRCISGAGREACRQHHIQITIYRSRFHRISRLPAPEAARSRSGRSGHRRTGGRLLVLFSRVDRIRHHQKSNTPLN
jgi:hypothetical protein